MRNAGPERYWYGETKSHEINPEYREANKRLADAAKRYEWPTVLGILDKTPDVVNTWRLDGKSRYTPLHQAAHGGAGEHIIQQLLARGAWRTLQNAHGERPVDVARRTDHVEAARLMEPVLLRHVPCGILLVVQRHLHDVIRSRADRQVSEYELRLPELEPLLEQVEPRYWFPVPGMSGGFSINLVQDGVAPVLLVESWCRVAEGSGQRHEITPKGANLVAEGFV